LAAAAQHRALLSDSLREVITAGEQLQVTPAIRALFERLGNCTLHNHYGPTESHVVTAFTLTGAPRDWPLLPPIGRPIANAQIYLLDAQRQPVPVGASGELYIGGDCLARGYLNRPELTAERFIPNPFIPGARLYQTGDRARYRADGQIEFLGRADQQVKVRGFRVELGEIEAVLREHPAVNAAAATADSANGVVGYVVAKTAPPPTAMELRDFLRQKLPDYMRPAGLVFLQSLPLTPSGKVDRKALPAPPPDAVMRQETFVAPRTTDEEILCGIWSEVLGCSGIGVSDNFFDLGGHSLLATQVVSRMRVAFGFDLTVRSLFDFPTVAGQACFIEALRCARKSVASSDRTRTTLVKGMI
jgi:hypothetical protein